MRMTGLNPNLAGNNQPLPLDTCQKPGTSLLEGFEFGTQPGLAFDVTTPVELV